MHVPRDITVDVDYGRARYLRSDTENVLLVVENFVSGMKMETCTGLSLEDVLKKMKEEEIEQHTNVFHALIDALMHQLSDDGMLIPQVELPQGTSLDRQWRMGEEGLVINYDLYEAEMSLSVLADHGDSAISQSALEAMLLVRKRDVRRFYKKLLIDVRECVESN